MVYPDVPLKQFLENHHVEKGATCWMSTVNISIPRLGDKEQCLRTFLWISVLYDHQFCSPFCKCSECHRSCEDSRGIIPRSMEDPAGMLLVSAGIFHHCHSLPLDSKAFGRYLPYMVMPLDAAGFRNHMNAINVYFTSDGCYMLLPLMVSDGLMLEWSILRPHVECC